MEKIQQLKNKKVEEPTGALVWECPRCNQNYCGDCVEPINVDFDIKDAPEGFNQAEIEWNGSSVCPWCYNQLIDKEVSLLSSHD